MLQFFTTFEIRHFFDKLKMLVHMTMAVMQGKGNFKEIQSTLFGFHST